ncbi:MAG: hypothetical protein IPM35_02630 [Myxococcales bacterium]|nr:hypothetical protein [Myxococcales bacterium]
MSTFAHYASLDAALVRAGFPPTSPWWLDQLERFYAHPTSRRFVGRVGRGGAKSTVAVRFALCELLFGDWHIPPGERHWAVFVSVRQDEAAARLRQAEAMCRALRVRASLTGDELRLEDRPLGMRALSATVASVSGPRAVCKVGDELAKWRNADGSANPAGEVTASLRAMSVTHPEAREFLISSPLGQDDFHAALMAAGDSPDQVTAEAPTWVANPSVSEQQTRELEPDERIWRREYAAIPQAAQSAAFDPDAIERAFEPVELTETWQPVLVIDASSGRKDAWTWAAVRWARQDDRRFLRFELVDGIEGRFWSQVSGADIVERLVTQVCRPRGIRTVHADQRESLMLRSAFADHGIAFREHAWTASSKPAAVELVRRWLAEETLVLPEHDKLRRELLAFEERITPSGSFTFGARGSGHDDYVALLITAAMADLERGLPGSPRLERREGDGIIVVTPQGSEFGEPGVHTARRGRGPDAPPGARNVYSGSRFTWYTDDHGRRRVLT